MKVLKFTALFCLALISYPIGIVYGAVVTCFRWATWLLMFDTERIGTSVYLIGVRMSTLLNATAATWLTAWLIVPGSDLKFGEYFPASAIIGKAHQLRHLSRTGRWVREQLEYLDPGHCERAAKRHGLIWK